MVVPVLGDRGWPRHRNRWSWRQVVRRWSRAPPAARERWSSKTPTATSWSWHNSIRRRRAPVLSHLGSWL